MVIYGYGKEYSGKVKFISYDGKYPNLCCGTLTLEIDGEVVVFKPENRFWYSGGNYSQDNIFNFKNEWIIYQSELPDKYRMYVADIDRVFNENVEFGCCRGCV